MSAALSERVGRVVAYPPLSEMDDRQRQEFGRHCSTAGLLDAFLARGVGSAVAPTAAQTRRPASSLSPS
jgi:hypothetical protein